MPFVISITKRRGLRSEKSARLNKSQESLRRQKRKKRLKEKLLLRNPIQRLRLPRAKQTLPQMVLSAKSVSIPSLQLLDQSLQIAQP